MKLSWSKFALIFGIWTAVGLVFAVNAYVARIQLGGPLPFHLVMVRPLLEHWIWAGLTPVVFWFAKRYPFSGPRLLRTVVIHLGFFVVVSVFHVQLSELLHVPMAYVAKHYEGPTFQLRFLLEFYSDIWMYWPLVAVWNLLDYQRRYREREMQAAQLESQLTKAQLEVLRMQLQPHFLFNTLNSISALIQEDSQAAEDMLADLSHLLRSSLRSSATQEITLQQEAALLATYLRIQKKRFEDRLNVRLDLSPDTVEAMVPCLLLQPIVENAIRHGIAPLARPGRIQVSSALSGDRLVLTVGDNGPGLPASHREGIGLSNTRQRLRQLYGESQSLQLHSMSGEGVTVKITIPFRLAEARSSEAGHEDSGTHSRRRAARAATHPVAADDRT